MNLENSNNNFFLLRWIRRRLLALFGKTEPLFSIDTCNHSLEAFASLWSSYPPYFCLFYLLILLNWYAAHLFTKWIWSVIVTVIELLNCYELLSYNWDIVLILNLWNLCLLILLYCDCFISINYRESEDCSGLKCNSKTNKQVQF